jgi:hypothetical protein
MVSPYYTHTEPISAIAWPFFVKVFDYTAKGISPRSDEPLLGSYRHAIEKYAAKSASEGG